MLVPIFLVLVLLVSSFKVSDRENLDEIKNSLSNISNISKIK